MLFDFAFPKAPPVDIGGAFLLHKTIAGFTGKYTGVFIWT